MGRKTVQTSANPDLSYEQVTTGDTPISIGGSLNAKGAWQPEIKLAYGTPDEAATNIQVDLDRILGEIEAALAKHNIPLAGRV